MRRITLVLLCFVFVACLNNRKVTFGEIVEMEKGEQITITGQNVTIYFVGSGTEHQVDDTVIDNANFKIKTKNEVRNLFVENINGYSEPIQLDGFKLKLVFSDGYHQTCSIILFE